jgi:hypothetical protein
MGFRRNLLVSAILALVGAGAARAQGDVLVPGDPPLTRANVDRFQRLWEWYCDIRLTPDEGRELRQAFVKLWRKRGKFGNQQALNNHRGLDEEQQALLKRNADERARERVQTREAWIANMRKSKDDVSVFLVPVYDAAYHPGGPNNPILVAGDPPLTRGMAELDNDVLEVLFDFRFSAAQRREAVRLLVAEWKTLKPAKKKEWARNNATWTNLPTMRSYGRNWQRACLQTKLLDHFRRDDASARDRWLLNLYETAYRPGSDRNPVLVAGKSPLTQQLVDRYGDYLEVVLDLSISGGFTAEQRKVLQGYLVKDWKKMSAEDRDELLADLKTWLDAAEAGTGNKAVGALRPKLLAQLQTARDNQRSLWLLEIRAQELKKFAQLTEMQRMLHETQLRIIRAMEPTGHYEYNPATRRYDRWVPNR